MLVRRDVRDYVSKLPPRGPGEQGTKEPKCKEVSTIAEHLYIPLTYRIDKKWERMGYDLGSRTRAITLRPTTR